MTESGEKKKPIQRVRYYDGQYLNVAEFESEQAYHLKGQRRLSRGLRIAGILEGLAVTDVTAASVKVTAGCAVDAQGRQIVLIKDQTLELGKTEPDMKLTIAIVYTDYPDEMSTIPDAVAGNTRMSEDPVLVVLEADGKVRSFVGRETPTDAQLGAKVVLAIVTMGSSGEPLDTLTGTQHAGIRLPGSLAVGAPEPGNDQRRDSAVDLAGSSVARLDLSTRNTAGLLAVYEPTDSSGSAARMTLGTTTATPLALSANGEPRLTVNPDGGVEVSDSLDVGPHKTTGVNLRVGGDTKLYGALSVAGRAGIGTEPASDAGLTIGTDQTNLVLQRDTASAKRGNQVLLYLIQREDGVPGADRHVNPSILFGQDHRFYHRIEARLDGFHLKAGGPDLDTHSGLTVGNLTATGAVNLFGEPSDVWSINRDTPRQAVHQIEAKTDGLLFGHIELDGGAHGNSAVVITAKWTLGSKTGTHGTSCRGYADGNEGGQVGSFSLPLRSGTKAVLSFGIRHNPVAWSAGFTWFPLGSPTS